MWAANKKLIINELGPYCNVVVCKLLVSSLYGMHAVYCCYCNSMQFWFQIRLTNMQRMAVKVYFYQSVSCLVAYLACPLNNPGADLICMGIIFSHSGAMG